MKGWLRTVFSLAESVLNDALGTTEDLSLQTGELVMGYADVGEGKMRIAVQCDDQWVPVLDCDLSIQVASLIALPRLLSKLSDEVGRKGKAYADSNGSNPKFH